MKYLKNEKGIALMIALILSAVVLAFSAALIYMVTQGTKMSGIEKRYSTALGASKGGVEISTTVINNAGNLNTSLLNISANQGSCLWDKLFRRKEIGGTDNWPNCNAAQKDPDVSTLIAEPDLRDLMVSLGTSPNRYNVAAKIVDTVAGNSPPLEGGFLEGTGVVESNSGIITPPHYPFMYRVEVRSENAANSDERAEFTILYAH